jgi:hypothetical protein
MTTTTGRSLLCIPLMALAFGGCKTRLLGPSKEALQALLQQEAQSLKTDGEKINPELGVKSVWNIESVEVREQPDNADQPWVGTIKFKIESKIREVDGSEVSQQFEKRFEYVYSDTLKRWIIQYTPPSQ